MCSYTRNRIQEDMGPGAPSTYAIWQAFQMADPILRSTRCTSLGEWAKTASLIGHRDVRNSVVIYYRLAQRGTTTPPFASSSRPRTAFAVTQYPLVPFHHNNFYHEDRSTFDYALEKLLMKTGTLIEETAKMTGDAPLDYRLAVFYGFLPPAGTTALWRTLAPRPHILTGEDSLVEKIRAQRRPVALVFSPAHADPYLNPVRWARLLPEIDEDSTIGYAFS